MTKVNMLKALSLVVSTMFSFALRATTLHGTLAGHPKTYVTVLRYVDCLTNSTEQIAEVRTDERGYFSLDLPAAALAGTNTTGINQFKILVIHESTSFFAQQAINQTVAETSLGKLSVREDKPGVNTELTAINKTLTPWYCSWMDTTTGRFLDGCNPNKVMVMFDSIRAACLSKMDAGSRELFLYLFAQREMIFLTLSTSHRYAGFSARKALADLEYERFATKPVMLNNPFYIDFLHELMYAKLNMNSLASDSGMVENSLQRMMQQAEAFKTDSLKEFYKVASFWFVYKSTYYPNGQTLFQFNRSADSIRNKLNTPSCRRELGQIVARYNNASAGTPFPLLRLPDENEVLRSLDPIHTPLILVDFWATWCGPCREKMEEFPELMEKYKGRLTIVSISVDQNLSVMKKFLDEKKYTGKWITLYNGPSGNYLDKLRIEGYPAFFLLDAKKNMLDLPHEDTMTSSLRRMLDGM